MLLAGFILASASCYKIFSILSRVVNGASKTVSQKSFTRESLSARYARWYSVYSKKRRERKREKKKVGKVKSRTNVTEKAGNRKQHLTVECCSKTFTRSDTSHTHTHTHVQSGPFFTSRAVVCVVVVVYGAM